MSICCFSDLSVCLWLCWCSMSNRVSPGCDLSLSLWSLNTHLTFTSFAPSSSWWQKQGRLNYIDQMMINTYRFMQCLFGDFSGSISGIDYCTVWTKRRGWRSCTVIESHFDSWPVSQHLLNLRICWLRRRLFFWLSFYCCFVTLPAEECVETHGVVNTPL